MNVAIIGAGISGLSCAIELRRNGIPTTIFEIKNYIGEGTDLGVCRLRLFDSFFSNPMEYLSKYYNIHLNTGLMQLHPINGMAPLQTPNYNNPAKTF